MTDNDVTPTNGLDLSTAHRHFSTGCFNAVWDLIAQRVRTPADDERMIHLAHASLYHWMERPDITERNLSVGYWLLARVYALAHRPAPAQDSAVRSLAHAAGESAFYRGYAHEALARAALVAGDRATFLAHLAEARHRWNEVADPEERDLLGRDLEDLVKYR